MLTEARPLIGDWNQLEQTTATTLRKVFHRSVYVRHIDVGSCNACESEILSLSNPYYNFHRLGVFFTSSPRHADLLLVSGVVTRPLKEVLLATYEAMPKPRLVVAIGVCALHGGVFHSSPWVVGTVDSVIPVDAWVPGCPPTPFAILQGILSAVQHRQGVCLDE
ncbi:NADH-quinone oxidoreductase subunit NuoB [Alicyclobacillaceae bacterium I2511]|nr:NADH-quinone oxidoreductase subunit NuoB [Alicyclobacillaceae bacterium I2511]